VFELVTPDRIYAIVGDSEEIRDGWMSLIADMIPASDPVSSMGDGESFAPKEVRPPVATPPLSSIAAL
jgi:hypothetical protein